MKFPTFVGPSYQAASYRADVEDTINFFTQTVESAGRVTDRTLEPTPGLLTFAATGLAPIRAQFALDGRSFAVIGFAFMELTDNGNDTGALTNRGTVDNDSLPATISGGGDAPQQLFITAGGTGYVYDLIANTLAAVPSAGTGLVQGGYLDGYFWALDETSTFRLSDLLDATTWDPLQVAQRNDAPDRWMAALTVGKYIWLWGSETTTVIYDSGAFPFPFTLVPGVLINKGIGPVFSAVDVNGAAVWLEQSKSGSRVLVRSDGFGVPVRISTHAMEYALRQYTTVEDAVAFSYTWDGHAFYQINFPTADASWTVDALSGELFKPLFWNTTTAAWECSRAQYHCFAFDRHLVGDRETGTIYALSGTTFTDAGGAPLRRLRRVPFPRILDMQDFINLQSLQVLMDVGIGLANGQGSDPQVMMRISRNGGKTWGPEHWMSAGAMGDYLTRVLWQRLGRFRDGMGVLEISVSDPVPFRLIGAEFEAVRGVA